ncbi:MAG: hypothetical protein MUP80_14980 [Acidobacteriia bacterium]|nr:hypothetical protein [Terriglobia bacterium]
MARWSFGSLRTRTIIIQVAIFAGVILWLTLALPKIQKERAAAELARGEQKIESFVQSAVVAAGGEEIAVSTVEGARRVRPQRLRITPAVGDVQQALGAPDRSMTDFRGGQHLTWLGTRHQLEASFAKGRLYAVTLTDLQTGHGITVYESSAQFRPF